MKYDIQNKSDDVDTLWKGTVRLSQRFIDCMSEPTTQNNVKVYTIHDHKFGNKDNAQFDNPNLSKNFPNKITVVLQGEKITEFMKCSAFTRRESFETKILVKSVKRKETIVKGFILEPLQHHQKTSKHAYLSVFQFDNANSSNQTIIQLDTADLRQSLIVEKLGCVAFASGSQGSSITFSKDPKKSVTIVYVASDQMPFVARLDTNQDKRRIVCKSNGAETKVDSQTEHHYLQTPTQEKRDPAPAVEEALKILNIRLAKGEITIYEYRDLRQVIENRTDQASTNWGA